MVGEGGEGDSEEEGSQGGVGLGVGVVMEFCPGVDADQDRGEEAVDDVEAVRDESEKVDGAGGEQSRGKAAGLHEGEQKEGQEQDEDELFAGDHEQRYQGEAEERDGPGAGDEEALEGSLEVGAEATDDEDAEGELGEAAEDLIAVIVEEVVGEGEGVVMHEAWEPGEEGGGGEADEEAEPVAGRPLEEDEAEDGGEDEVGGPLGAERPAGRVEAGSEEPGLNHQEIQDGRVAHVGESHGVEVGLAGEEITGDGAAEVERIDAGDAATHEESEGRPEGGAVEEVAVVEGHDETAEDEEDVYGEIAVADEDVEGVGGGEAVGVVEDDDIQSRYATEAGEGADLFMSTHRSRGGGYEGRNDGVLGSNLTLMYADRSSKLRACETGRMMPNGSPAPKILVQRLLPEAQLPKYAHAGAFGDLAADLYAAEALELLPGATAAVRTGIAMELPATHGALVEDRSGLAVRGITTLAGVIDPGYRGEVKVVMTNLGAGAHAIEVGQRIAQLRIVERIEAVFEETATLEDAPRGAGGFGSTGA